MNILTKLYAVVLIAGAITSSVNARETREEKEKRMQWFTDAKLGIFIHYGIYSVKGIGESWSFHNGLIPYEDYMKQLKGFTAKNYNPTLWADLIKESGARYSVITTKHHDGVALWDTKMNDLSVVKKSPAGRDIIGPFCDALRKNNIKVGLYYSLIDWSHPDYPGFLKNMPKYSNDSIRWKKFLNFYQGQLDELSKKYRPDLYWFDGDWEHSAEEWQAKSLRERLFGYNPDLIINSRLQGYGDYDTPEQGVPLTRPEAQWWELCMTMNDSWGYQGNDKNYKTANQLLRIFTDCISMGGNLLLDIGPKSDGTIPDEQVSILKEFGRWTKKHSEAIFGTVAGISRNYFSGPSALSEDKKKLYLFVDYIPKGEIVIKGLKNNVSHIYVVGEGTELSSRIISKLWWSNVPGLLCIKVPEEVLDDQITVICVALDEPVDLHGEK